MRKERERTASGLKVPLFFAICAEQTLRFPSEQTKNKADCAARQKQSEISEGFFEKFLYILTKCTEGKRISGKNVELI